MHDARTQSIADLRAQIKAIEAGSGTSGRSDTHPRQFEGNPLCPDKLECREDTISEIQQKSVSWPAGCPIIDSSENPLQSAILAAEQDGCRAGDGQKKEPEEYAAVLPGVGAFHSLGDGEGCFSRSRGGDNR